MVSGPGVSERLPSAHPAATSTRCVWTKVHAGVVVICSDQPVLDRFVVFDFGVFSRVCSGVLWGMRESAVSDSGRGHWFFFLGRWYRKYEEKASRPMEFELCSLHVAPSNSQNLCIYVLYYVLYYISSLCSGGFADATAYMCWFGVWWDRVTDVPRTGCARLGSATRRVSF
jgi:hypothetical protein